MEESSDVQVRSLLKHLKCTENNVSDIIESMKIMRTVVGQQPQLYQKMILDEENAVLNTSERIVNSYNKNDKEVTVQQLYILWQFLHNLCVGQAPFCIRMWVRFETPILALLGSETDPKLRNVLSAIVLQVIKHDDAFARNSTLTTKVIKMLLEIVVSDKEELQFPVLVIQELLRNQPEFSIVTTYENLEPLQRFALLDILAEESVQSLDERFIYFLIETFKTQATILMTVLKTENVAEPSEVTRVLKLLSSFSHTDEFMILLQSDKSLLIDSVYLLRMVHDVGKDNPNNTFSIIKNMYEVEDKEKMESDPVFGFKRDLIRLIGNLCHKNKENQDQVGEINGIELILDCSPIDGKNPFITQWVLFAIRNICLGNPNNQAVLNSISKEGKMDKKVLEEVGVQIQNM